MEREREDDECLRTRGERGGRGVRVLRPIQSRCLARRGEREEGGLTMTDVGYA